MNKRWLNWAIICLSIILFAAYLVWKEGMGTIIEIAGSINYWWLGVALASMLLALLFEAGVLTTIRRQYQTGFSFASCFRSTVVGFMFGAITPLQVGNLASQITILTKDGMKAGDAATVLLTKTILYMCSMVAVVGILLIVKAREFAIPTALWIVVFVGFAINAIYLCFLLLVARAERILGSIACWFIRLLGKMHIVKQVESLQETTKEELHQLNVNMRKIQVKGKDLFIAFLFGCLQLVATYQICYFIYRCFSLSGQTYGTVLAAQAFCTLVQSVMPIPGGLGVADSGFYYILGKIMGEHYINFAMVLWRLITLYLPILFGLGVLFSKKKKPESLSV